MPTFERLALLVLPLGACLANPADDLGEPLDQDQYAIAGALDGTFGSGGAVTTNVDVEIDNAQYPVVRVLPDGKFLLAGSDDGSGVLVRRLASGLPDLTFGNSGTFLLDVVPSDLVVMPGGDYLICGGRNGNMLAEIITSNGQSKSTAEYNLGTANDFASAMAVQPDGKVLLAGSVGNATDAFDFGLVRLVANSLTKDSSFGTSGQVITDVFGDDDSAAAVVVHPTTGKITVTGSDVTGFEAQGQFAIVRYLATGALDSTWGAGGKVTLDVGGGNDRAASVTLASGGKTVVVGAVRVPPSTLDDIGVIRLNDNGTLDTSFDGDGKKVFSVGTTDNVRRVAEQTDGKLVLTGHAIIGTTYDFLAARLNTNGSLDTSFSGDGLVTTAIGTGHDNTKGFVLQADGKLLLSGHRTNGTERRWTLVRYTTTGALDTTFDGDGKLVLRQDRPDEEVANVAVQSDGKIVAVGSGAVVRYTSTGALDSTFSGDGVAGVTANSAAAVAIQADGKIVVAGSDNQTIVVTRVTTSGTADTTFSGDGRLTLQVGTQTTVAADVLIQPDQKIVVGGYVAGQTPIGGGTAVPGQFLLARWNADGTPDTSFDGDGVVLRAWGGSPANTITAIALETSGRIVATGYTDATTDGKRHAIVARWTAGGFVDTTFGAQGVTTTQIASEWTQPRSIAIQADGKIVIAGNAIASLFQGDMFVARYTTNGALDTSYDGDGVARRLLQDSCSGDGVSIDGSGRAVVVGTSALLADLEHTSTAVVRLNTNGTPDTSFSGDGAVEVKIGGSGSNGRALVLQSNGAIVVAGSALVSGFKDFALARFQSI